jgi:carboxymethylenebutenolidase
MVEHVVDLQTVDGTMKTFIFHPEHGGPHPLVVYLMDARSIRPALKDMASRLATAGYYVMLPYLYYRAAPFREFTLTDAEMHTIAPLISSATPSNIVGDAEALFRYADKDEAAETSKVATVGFCMGGALAVALAGAFPDRVRAAASIHGAWLVRDTPDSPHLSVKSAEAELYFAWCADDDMATQEDLGVMRARLADAGVTHTIDWFADALHGFAPPGNERYNRAASELHWERVHALLRRNL